LLRARARDATCALVFEAGRVGDAIITRRKGTGTLRVEATGKAAHAGNAHNEGASAIWSMARWIDRAHALTDHARGITVNVGRIEGGTSKNTVADRCRAEVDVRYITLDDGESIVKALRAAADEVCVPGTAITLTCEAARTPLERTTASAALYARYAVCQREASLGDAEAPLQGGGSDASTTAAVGVPSIDGLGPRGKGFHTLDEQVDLTTLVPKAEALLRFLWSTRRE
jgi:glutamate carboxypeptidase